MLVSSTTIEVPQGAHTEVQYAPAMTRRERNWFENRLEQGKSERLVEIATISPALAARMLQQNLGNRSMRQSRVDLHANRIQRGTFILTHQGIAFAKTGVLNDGQHRLAGIVKAGIPVKMQVTFGAEREEFSVVDQLATRSAADMLGIYGQTHTALRASVAKMLYMLKLESVATPDPQVVADYAIEVQSSLMDTCLRFGQSMSKVTNPTSAAVAMYWIAKHTRRDMDALDEFCEGLTTGEGLVGVKLRLRELLRKKDVGSSANGVKITMQRAGVIIHAWNAYVSGRRSFSQTWHTCTRLPKPE